MPSVGGGGGGGGFHGGGGGGGFHGGGSGGGYRGGGYHRNNFYYFGGGYGYGYRRGSSIAGAVVMIILGIIALIVGIYFNKSPKALKYSESAFQDLALNKYNEIYGEGDENRVLFVLLTSKNATDDGYWQISMVGDNLVTGINEMFGGNSTTFGKAFDDMLPKGYLNSLLPAYRNALEKTADAITTKYPTESSRYYHGVIPNEVAPKYICDADYVTTSKTSVMEALTEFKDETGITLSIYVGDQDATFKRRGNFIAWVLIIAGAALLVGGIIMIVVYIKKKNDGGKDSAPQANESRPNDPYGF